MKHLSKVEVSQNDPSGCTFTLGFDSLRSQSVAPPQWTTRNKDDRNRILLIILNLCKENLGRLPKMVGIDVVELALWAKDNNSTVVANQTTTTQAGPNSTSAVEQNESQQVAVEQELVSQAEEEDMEALLGMYVMRIGEAEIFSERLKREFLALEAANVHALLESESVIEEVLRGLEAATICVEDMDEWLSIFNVKLRHMREDIESIESRNNKLELQSVRDNALIDELDRLLQLFQFPTELMTFLTGGSFDEANMHKTIEACEWLIGALKTLEASNLDPCYARFRAVKEKRAELVLSKCTFVRRVSEFLRNYFPSLVDFMLNDNSLFSHKGHLKRPDHTELRTKSRTYAKLLQYIKVLDKNCLGPLRKAYSHSLNLLLRREAHEFSEELRASTKVPRSSASWLEGPVNQAANNNDSSVASEAYLKIITVFIPLFIDESLFLANLMFFDLAAVSSNEAGSDVKKPVVQSSDQAELTELNECLKGLLEGVQEDFYAIIDWAFKIDPLCCIPMHEITESFLSGQKNESTGFVHLLLDDLATRISILFSRFVDDVCFQVEKFERNQRQMGVLAYIPRFAILATRMEHYIQGQSRDLVDQAYLKIVSIMFVVLEKTAELDPKYADIVLFENYAAFQNSVYDLANAVPTLAKFYHQACECYEQACLRHINMVIYIHFERLIHYARRLEEMLHTVPAEEIPFQIGMSKTDLRKMLKASLSGLDKTINAMYRKLQKNVTAEELLPTLWDKCKKEFLEKYGSFTQLVNRIYPSENIPSVSEMREAFSSL